MRSILGLFLLWAMSSLLIGCQTPPAVPAISSPSEGTSGAFCTLVSTLTTTVRTAVLQVSSEDTRSFEVSDSCALKTNLGP